MPHAHWPLLHLRPTLTTTIVGLVLLTAVAIGGSAAILTLADTREAINQARSAAVGAATGEVQQFFDIAPRITTELAAEARRGVLPLDQRSQLVALFAERLRATPQLAWIGYGNGADGSYVGATRYGANEIVEYIADPAIDGGRPAQVAVAADGTRSRPSFSETAPYLVVTKDWYKQGIAAPGPLWLDFYQFTSGGPGITCVTRIETTDGHKPTGLFHADLRVERIAGFLSGLHVGERGAVFLLDKSGRRVVSSAGEHVAAAEIALDTAARNPKAIHSALPTTVTAAGHSYEIVFAPTNVTGNVGLLIGVVIDLADITDGIYRQAEIAAIVSLGAVLLAIVLGILLSSHVARPVAEIAADLATVGAFQISTQPSPRSFLREVSDLGNAVNGMKASLRSFGRYVPADLVRTLLAAGSEARLGGETRRLTLHFSDVADFTSISEGMEPRQLVDAMGRYFDMMTTTLMRHGGTVDKFMGDGILAFFNAPTELPDHPRHACLAALEAQQALAEMARAARPGEPVFRARIGLGLGDVLVGNIGTPDRFAYTVIGDEVNLASRLEGLNKVYGTRIMATDVLAAEAGDAFEWRRLDRVAVKGRQHGTPVCELLGLRGAVPPETLAARDVYEQALAAYYRADFATAAALFADAMRARTGDIAAQTMHERSVALAAAPPDAWNGVHVMHEK